MAGVYLRVVGERGGSCQDGEEVNKSFVGGREGGGERDSRLRGGGGVWREKEEGGGVWREWEEAGGLLVVESARLEEDCSVWILCTLSIELKL